MVRKVSSAKLLISSWVRRLLPVPIFARSVGLVSQLLPRTEEEQLQSWWLQQKFGPYRGVISDTSPLLHTCY